MYQIIPTQQPTLYIIVISLTLCEKRFQLRGRNGKCATKNGKKLENDQKTFVEESKTFWEVYGRRIQNQQANANWCLVGGFSSVPAIPMTLMEVLPMSSSMAVPWWLTSLSDPFLNCSITVVITTLAKGINWPKMSQMSIILMYAVDGNLSITAMKMVVITNIVVRFTVTEAFYIS